MAHKDRLRLPPFTDVQTQSRRRYHLQWYSHLRHKLLRCLKYNWKAGRFRCIAKKSQDCLTQLPEEAVEAYAKAVYDLGEAVGMQ